MSNRFLVGDRVRVKMDGLTHKDSIRYYACLRGKVVRIIDQPQCSFCDVFWDTIPGSVARWPEAGLLPEDNGLETMLKVAFGD